MSEYLYTVLTEEDGTVHYFETWLNPNGVWVDGRVDYRVQTKELPFDEWVRNSVILGE